MRFLALPTLIIGSLAATVAVQPARPLTPTSVSWKKTADKTGVLGEIAADLSKQSGVPIQVAPSMLKTMPKGEFKGYEKVPLWEALQQTADATGTRITLVDGGRKVQLVPRGKARDAAATSGSFRVVAQQVVGRALLDQGVIYHEVHLLVHWEPRLRVYRIDSAPKISAAKDVPGVALKPEEGGSQVLPLDSTSEMKVKLYGLTRDSEKITTLAGTFTVTAAEKMLPFTFDPTGKIPAAGTLPEADKNAGVSASLKRVQKKDDTWEVEVEVTYPPNQPIFESFQGEWWLRDNKLVVRSQQGKSFVIDDYEVPSLDNPRPLRVIHRFKEDKKTGLGDPTQKGWSITYETPGPLADVKIPFELKNIPLP